VSRRRLSIPFLLDLLSLAVRKEASAVYVVPWMPPTMRLDERMVTLSSAAFTPEQTTALVRDVLDDEQRAALDQSREIQFSFLHEGIGRFRVHAFRRHGQPAMAIRPFAIPVPTLASLALPLPLPAAALAERGLVVVASRSPSLRGDGVAAIVDHRNRHGHGSILLLEDASRYWIDSELCAVEQGVGSGHAEERAHTRALQPGAAPLAIAWGELRDGPALARAVRASGSALCIVTVAADGVVDALRACTAMCDSLGDLHSLTRFAMSIEAVVSLIHVRAKGGERDLAAAEVLLNSPDVAASVDARDFPALHSLLHGMRGRGSVTRDDHLLQLLAQGLVGYDEALRHASDAVDLAHRWRLGPQTVAPAWSPRAPAADAPPLPPAPPRAADFNPFVEGEAGGAGVDDNLLPAAEQRPPVADTSFDSVDWPRTDQPTLSGGPGAAPLPRTAPEPVHFRAYATAALGPGGSGAVEVWACLPAQVESDVAPRAGSVPAAVRPRGATRGPLVAVQLRADGLQVEQPLQFIPWLGEPAAVRFAVAAPAGAAPGAHPARVRLSVAGLAIGELSFILNVGAEADSRFEDTHAARHMLRSAYASYAVEDRGEVLARLQSMQKVAPELELFVDAQALHAGERWRERIERELGRRERLVLFWSAAAAQSPWVDYEWRLALRTRALASIEPAPLADPMIAPPPPELAELNFAELYVAGHPAAHRLR